MALPERDRASLSSQEATLFQIRREAGAVEQRGAHLNRAARRLVRRHDAAPRTAHPARCAGRHACVTFAGDGDRTSAPNLSPGYGVKAVESNADRRPWRGHLRARSGTPAYRSVRTSTPAAADSQRCPNSRAYADAATAALPGARSHPIFRWHDTAHRDALRAPDRDAPAETTLQPRVQRLPTLILRVQ
jgi:hypothetical protein